MITKSPCEHCGTDIEFATEDFVTDSYVSCPHCGEQTPLSLQTKTKIISPPPEPEPAPPQVEDPRRDWRMIVTTGNDIAGNVIKTYIGIALGIVVRSPDIGQQLFGGLKQIVGGNIESYAYVCEAARKQAFDRMVQDAVNMNADAVIAMRYDATEFAPGATEVLAYGTAVKLAER